MDPATVKEQILIELERLAPDEQREVLDFTRTLATRKLKGVTLDKITRHIGTIPADDLDRMAQVIEEACEQIDPETWNIELPG